jgi:membrane-bound serine protease (ClpP class)
VIPATFIFGLKRLTLKKAQNDGEGYTSGPAGLDALLSREGTALTPLRPSGTAVIDGKRVDVVTEGEMIDKDKPVRVIKVEGGRVVVRMV